MLIVKYNGNGSQLWTSNYRSTGDVTQVEAAVIDLLGNVYLVTDSYLQNYVLNKYARQEAWIWTA